MLAVGRISKFYARVGRRGARACGDGRARANVGGAEVATGGAGALGLFFGFGGRRARAQAFRLLVVWACEGLVCGGAGRARAQFKLALTVRGGRRDPPRNIAFQV